MLTGRKWATRIAVGLIIAAPFLRVGTYFLVPAMRGRIGMMLHTRVDALMVGCALALATKSGLVDRWKQRLLSTRNVIVAAIFLAIVSPLLTVRFGGRYVLPFGYSADGIAIALLMMWFVLLPTTRAARVLNNRLLVHVGVCSYSLYLWQQVFLNPTLRVPVLGCVVMLVIAAECSLRFVEQPFLRLRARLQKAAPAIGRAASQVA
jgi:peptidoglycan/LPS O-acetylase OafA/YrhL